MGEQYTLFQGDCLEVMPTLPPQSVNLILCDLPYGVTACKWDTVIPFDKLWEAYKRILKPKGAVVLTATQPFSSALVMSNPKWFRHEWIWDKVTGVGFQIAKHLPMQQHEHVLIFGNGSINYYPLMVKLDKPGSYYLGKASSVCQLSNKNNDQKRIRTHSYPKSILRFSNAAGCYNKTNIRYHPTQKPLGLLEYLIQTYSNEGDIVLDNCMGSGSTGVAALNLGRKFVGIEMDEKYFKVASDRIEQSQQPKQTSAKEFDMFDGGNK